MALDEFADLDGLIAALYGTVSGPAGEEPDWERERSLYLPEALLVRATQVDAGTPRAAVMDVEAFIQSGREYLRDNDFYERELARRTFRFGRLAHVLSTYETSSDPEGALAIARGVHSLQLYNDGSRWWIVSAVWDTETEDNPLPAEFVADLR